MARRGKLGEREATESRKLFLLVERGWRWGRVQEKHPLPKCSWTESGKVETAAATELKEEKGKRRGFKFH